MAGADWQARGRDRGTAVALALIAVAVTFASSAAGEATPQLTASLAPSELTLGASLSVTGRLTQAGQGVAGVPLTLQADAYPFRGFVAVAHTATAPDGSFSFQLRPERNTHLRVIGEGAAAIVSPLLSATVDPGIVGSARSLGPGRVRLSLRVRHALTGGAHPVSVWWFLATRAVRVFRLAAVTSTRELSPGVTYASAVVDPPTKRFVYRVCLNPPWERAMGAAGAHRACPHATFVQAGDAR
jgi:hypothetical protein